MLSVIFLVRAIGAVIGTVGSGILMDRYSRLQYALLCSFLLVVITGECGYLTMRGIVVVVDVLLCMYIYSCNAFLYKPVTYLVTFLHA